jgi:uncharacterized protein YneF (UPF0154 family)
MNDAIYIVSLLCAVVSGFIIGTWLGRRDG